MAKVIRKTWGALHTLLIVGEGFHDVAFLKHVKSVFISRECGLSVTIKNAGGKGARNVIKYAIRQSKNADYDDVAALFDTDQDWGDSVEKLAMDNRIKTLKSERCLEEMLLRALKLDCQGSSSALKKRLAITLEGDAGEPDSYTRCFTRDILKDTKEPTLKALIEFLCDKIK